MTEFDIDLLSCPLPKMDYATIQLAHGAGGKLSAELIEKIFIPRFGNETLDNWSPSDGSTPRNWRQRSPREPASSAC